LQSAPRPQLTLTDEFRPRPVRFLGLWELGDWRVKAYSLQAEHTRLLPGLVSAAQIRAAETLAQATGDGYGIGFVGIHSGRDANFVFVDWWARENELHHHVFTSSKEDPTQLRPAVDGVVGCVWDLQVIWFERNAWVEKVLGGRSGPDIEAYLKKVLDDA
jgi:prepilin-type processing-associated H-X9-DG protein